MANIHNDKFIDAIDKLNKMAYMLVNGNAKVWAAKAVERKIITYDQRARIVQLVDLRNSMGHGNSVYINVGAKEVEEVKKYIAIMDKTSDLCKGSGGTSNRRGLGSSTNANRGYFQSMYGYQGSTFSGGLGSSYARRYEFVSNVEAEFAGKNSSDYGWVICNPAGEFLMETAYIWWTSDFDRAVVFKSEKEAKKQVDFFLSESSTWRSSSIPFLRVKCIKMR